MRTLHITVATDQFADLTIEQDVAQAFGAEVSFQDSSTTERMCEAGRGADGVIVTTETASRSVLEAWAPTVRVLCRAGAGLDNIDLEAAQELGIRVFNVPDYCTEEVATHALSLILIANRRILSAQRLARAVAWSQIRFGLGEIKPLSECTLGIVGLGQIGRHLALMTLPLFKEVRYFDPKATAITSGISASESLEELFCQSDFISLHTPLTPATHHMVNREVLRESRPGLTLVNVARGGLVDAEAVIEAIDRGLLSCFATDVLEVEPPAADDPLIAHPSVIVTGHTAWISTEAVPRLRRLSMERLCQALRDSLHESEDGQA